MAEKSGNYRVAPATWPQLLRPGFGLKRWLLAVLAGVVLAGLGITLLLEAAFIHASLAPLLYWMTLQFVPPWGRGFLLLAGGVGIVLFSVMRLYRTIFRDLWPELQTSGNRELLDALLRRYQRRYGPKIVAIGGGTGMPQLLRGLRKYTDNITAIVTVADDGGSSGRLRQSLGMLPPGDFRNNIAALSEAEGLMARLFQYRFADQEVGDGQRQSELAGHSFGNLFITTMAAVTGSFEAGIAESSNVLRVRGRVLPSTLENVTLCAEVHATTEDNHDEWQVVQGESKLSESGGRVERVFLEPGHARAYPEAIRAILQADLIVAGPGSFFTSVLPNVLVQGVRDAICAAEAPRIYICNVATQAGETDHYTVAEHMRKLHDHAGDAFPMVLANDNYDQRKPPSRNSQWVTLPPPDDAWDFRLFTGDVVDVERPWRHDSDKLAGRLMEVYAQCLAERVSEK